MFMKQHILAALREEFDQWEALLAGMSEAQLTAPRLPSRWSIKDELAHLWAWQQRSIARIDAALGDQEPVFPVWAPGLDPEVEANTDQVNAWIDETYREEPWPTVYRQWREGFLRFLEAAEAIAEKDLLDAGKYPWLDERPLAFILLGSYDHHQEHFDGALAWLHEQKPGQ
jgi:hypothetical protein